MILELKNFYASDDQGNVLPGATCYVYQRGTETLVQGLLKPNGYGLMNPFAAGPDGLVQFAAANGLYDVRVVSDKRDSRLPIQFNDVTEDLAAARAAATRSEAASDAAQLSAGIYGTVALGLLATVSGKYFSVPSEDANEFLILYKNEGGVAVETKRYPAADAVTGALASLELLEGSALLKEDFEDTTQFATAFLDANKSVVLGFTPNGEVVAGGVNITELDERSTSSSEFEHTEIIAGFLGTGGASPLGFDQNGDTHIGNIEFETRDLNERSDGVVMPITDAQGNLVFGFERKTGKLLANLGEQHVSDVSTYVDVAPTVEALKLKLGASNLRFGGQSYPLTDISVDAATMVSATANAYPLKFVAYVTHPPQKFFDIDAADWLGYSSVVVSSVKKVSDNSALVIGLDVTYSENGKVVLMRPGADVAVNIAYVGKMERYDLVAYSLVTNSLVVRKGVERRTTAQEDLYRGKAQAGDIPLYSVYVIGGAIREVIKLWNWRGVRNKNTNAEQTAMYLENRRRLSRFLNKLHKSKGVIVTGYGDSNTALGGGHSSSADYLPNRPGVDTTPFQGPFMLSDLETDFRTAFLDSIGKVVLNGVTRYKAGPNWQVIDAICNSHGYTFVADKVPVAGEITYLNQGISSSTSSAVGVYNGLYPDRLNAMINPAGFRTPDLVLLGFGMNDGTIESFVTTTSQLIQAIKAAGSDVFLVGPHWTNSNGIRFTEAEWHLIHRRLSEVAEFHDVAYLPSELFYSGDSRGFLGVSDYSLTRANWINHPGPYEYRMNGVAIAQYFK